MRRRKEWKILDKWAFVEGDATREALNTLAKQMRTSHANVPGLEVRWYKRSVRAAGTRIEVVAIVARAPLYPYVSEASAAYSRDAATATGMYDHD